MSDDTADRRARGLERLKELGDHPGGESFLERMGEPMSTWLVDWVFGDVHARPNLSARERELVALKFFAGLKTAEIAEVIGTGERAAAMRVHRTIEKLRRACDEAV